MPVDTVDVIKPPEESYSFKTIVRKTTEASSSEADNGVQAKKAVWDAKRKEIDKVTDALGLGIDEGIKETVTALNVNGLNTTMSCEGHNSQEHGLLTPWVDVAAPNRPDIQYLDEMDVFQKAADKYGIPLDEFRRGKNIDTWWEAIQESKTHGETPEYAAWKEKSEALESKADELLSEFYSKREAEPETRLHRTDLVEGVGRIWSGSVEEHFSRQNIMPEAKKATLLLKRQVEMAAFTDFLRSKYYSS